MKEQLIEALKCAVSRLGVESGEISLEYPENPEHGDFSTSVALAAAKQAKLAPKALAEKLIAELDISKKGGALDFVESVTIAGPGFINFKVKENFLAEKVVSLADADPKSAEAKTGRQIMVEYTDPNPFKVFHIGHLMSNAIGESISRLIEHSGAEVIRANWQGDVGPHVAKAIWGAMNMKETKSDFASVAIFWGHCYAFGAERYDADGKVHAEIDEINKKVYDRSDEKINKLYDAGRQQSLDAFEEVYKRLGTKFDNYFFEGKEGRNGEAIVREHLKDGIFTESEGAIIFKGEDHGLHTRVFITSKGLPTYETKELGLNTEKFKIYPDLAESIIVTANEQNDYFKVLLKVFSLIRPDIANKTKHLSHGMMRFASGKMSSRKGNVIAAETLIDEIKSLVLEKMTGREFDAAEEGDVADMVALAAIKYTILRQGIGGDVIFDSAKSISFEGDSGPYLQYSAVRAQSVLEKAKQAKNGRLILPEKVGLLERLIVRFPDIADRARQEYAPQHVANYLINLAGSFNSFYGMNPIVGSNQSESPYRIELTKAFLKTMTDGLWLLGIKVPRRM